MIEYSHEELEKILGGPVAKLAETDDIGRRYARTLTDTLRGKDRASTDRFRDGITWLKYQHFASLDQGKRTERTRWESKIRSLFGLN